MNYSPGVTIVIPVRDRARIVRRTLDSVASQTLRPLSVVLVDNSSSDGTLGVLQSWAREVSAPDFSITVVEESHPGAAAARNRGLQEVTTEWTMFFDSDDSMEPEHCMRAMKYAHDADIVGWDVRYHDLAGRESVKPFYDRDLQYHSLMHGSMATQRYMARTALFEAAGKWNICMRGWDDIELGSRILSLNPRVRCVDGEPNVDIWATEESITGRLYSDRLDQYLEALRAIEKNIGGFSGKIYTDVKRAILAADCRREGGRCYGDIIGCRMRLHGLKNRLLLRLIYLYRLMGGRGAARLFRPFL
ncbi:MAG: glycosyltransferase family 2 protein [Muribaculaceae bacterium]|nr:glycosyltransferase family 2 protein [Muribaculaceae bacterium]